MVDSAEQRLVAGLRRFPGIAGAVWKRGRLTISFDGSLEGDVAEMVWLRVANRYDVESPGDGWILGARQCEDCARRLYYASDYFASPDYLPERDAGRAVSDASLYCQLCRIYTAIEHHVEALSGLRWAGRCSASRANGEVHSASLLSMRFVRTFACCRTYGQTGCGRIECAAFGVVQAITQPGGSGETHAGRPLNGSDRRVYSLEKINSAV